MDTFDSPACLPLVPVAPPTHVRRCSTRVLRYNSSLPAAFVEELWRAPQQLLAAGTTMRKTEKLRATVVVEWESNRYVVKHYGNRSLRHALKHSLIGSQARQSFRLGCRLADAGLRTPRPVACLERREGLTRRDSYLVYPFAEGRSLLHSITEGHLGDLQIEQVARKLKALFRQLIALKVGLRDANTGNFIITPDSQLWIIDLDDSRVHRLRSIAHVRLHRRWKQLCRGIRRAKQARDRQVESARRAA